MCLSVFVCLCLCVKTDGTCCTNCLLDKTVTVALCEFHVQPIKEEHYLPTGTPLIPALSGSSLQLLPLLVNRQLTLIELHKPCLRLGTLFSPSNWWLMVAVAPLSSFSLLPRRHGFNPFTAMMCLEIDQ